MCGKVTISNLKYQVSQGFRAPAESAAPRLNGKNGAALQHTAKKNKSPLTVTTATYYVLVVAFTFPCVLHGAL